MTRLLLPFLLLLCGMCAAQYASHDPSPILRDYLNSREDTGRVRLLFQLGKFYLEKSGEEKSDLDSATLLFTRAKDLSLHLGYPAGAEQARFLIGRVMVERMDHTGLLNWLPALSDTDRTTITAYLIDNLLNPAHRSPARIDTAKLVARRTLRLNENSPHPGDQLTTLLKFAILQYCKDEKNLAAPPPASWTSITNLSGNKDWLKPILDWMEVYLQQDTAMTTDLLRLRKRLRSGYSRPDQKEMLDNIRFIFIKFFGMEAMNNQYHNRPEPAEKELTIGVDFDSTKPLIDIATWYNAAFFFESQGALSKALRYGLNAIRALEKEKEIRNGCQLPYYIVGVIYNELHQPALSLGYLRKAMELTKKQGLVTHPYILKYMTDSWIALGQPQTALRFLQDSINPALLQDHKYKQKVSESIGECYYAMGQYEKAGTWYQQGLSLASKSSAYELFVSQFYLGKAYFKLAQYEKARTLLLPIVADSANGFNNVRMREDAEKLLFEVDSATGNYLSAIRHLQAFQTLNASIFDNTKSKEIEELRLQYETEKKDQDILLQQTALRQSRLVRNGLLAGAVLLILLLLGLYSRYRSKQKMNRLLQVRQSEIDASNHRLQLLNSQQQKLLREKEWLMREIHHRVKNNLQIVISLLNMQAAHLKDEMALNAFGEIRSRIRAISLIHQKLYQEDEDMTVIHMPDYIDELLGFLEDSFVLHRRIRFRVEVDPVKLDVSQCVPVGLILNEAITNAIKYAFPDESMSSVITILLRQEPDDGITMMISDNGKGLPEKFDLGSCPSMGLQLIRTLACQLDGSLSLENTPGLTITIRFRTDHPATL